MPRSSVAGIRDRAPRQEGDPRRRAISATLADVSATTRVILRRVRAMAEASDDPTWLLAALREVMDKRVALERIAATSPQVAGAPKRIIAEERVTTTRTLAEDAAIFAGARPARRPPPREARDGED